MFPRATAKKLLSFSAEQSTVPTTHLYIIVHCWTLQIFQPQKRYLNISFPCAFPARRTHLGSPEKYRSHHVRREETQCSFTSFCNVEKTLFLLCLFGQVGNNISILFCFSVPPFPVYVMSDAFSFRTRRNNYRSSCEKTQSSCAPYLTRSCTRRSISSVGKFWAFRWKTKS